MKRALQLLCVVSLTATTALMPMHVVLAETTSLDTNADTEQTKASQSSSTESTQVSTVNNTDTTTGAGVPETSSSSKPEEVLNVTDTTSESTVAEPTQNNMEQSTAAATSAEMMADAEPQATVVATGMLGTSTWEISSDGILTIGAGTFPRIDQSTWKSYSDQINVIRFSGNVVAGSYMNNLFDGLNKVTEIQNLNYLNTSKTTRMMYAFRDMASLESIDVSGFDTSKVETFTSMFSGMSKIKTLDLSTFSTVQASSYVSMFSRMPALTELNISTFGANGVANAFSMFNTDSVNLRKITVGPKTPFNYESGLPEHPATGSVTAGWIGINTGNYYPLTRRFTQNYDGTAPDTYVFAARLLVRYVDDSGATLNPDKEFTGYVGGSYDVSTDAYKPTIPGYTLNQAKLPTNATGTIPENLLTVTYVYSKNPVKGADVTVKYVDDKGAAIANPVTLAGNVGASYTAEQKEISGYTFKRVDGNPNGTFTNTAQTVTYVYTKNPAKGADVTVNYVDDKGAAITNPVTLSGNLGASYTTEQKTISGYTFARIDGNPTGTFTNQAQTVTYIYTKDPVKGADVTVNYVDENNRPITAAETLSGNIGEAYATGQKEITDYTFLRVEGDPNGLFTDQAQMVTYVYTKNAIQGAAVNVRYVDEAGQTISDPISLTGFIGASYKTETKVIEGYTLKEITGNPEGLFTNNVQQVTYVYTKNSNQGAIVEVDYVDENGRAIVDPVFLSGKIGAGYATEQKILAGYTLKKVEGRVTGSFTTEAQQVVYIYTKTPVNGSKPNNATNSPTKPANNSAKNDFLPKAGTQDSVQFTLAGLLALLLVAGAYFKRNSQRK